MSIHQKVFEYYNIDIEALENKTGAAEVLEIHKLMFNSMVRSSGLTKEEFLKKILEE